MTKKKSQELKKTFTDGIKVLMDFYRLREYLYNIYKGYNSTYGTFVYFMTLGEKKDLFKTNKPKQKPTSSCLSSLTLVFVVYSEAYTRLLPT